LTSLFISYSRSDLESARKRTDPFMGQEFDFWIDGEGSPPTVDGLLTECLSTASILEFPDTASTVLPLNGFSCLAAK